MKKLISLLLAATLLGGLFLTGCRRPRKGDIQIDVSTMPSEGTVYVGGIGAVGSKDSNDSADAAGPGGAADPESPADAGSATDTASPVPGINDKTGRPLSTTPTKGEDGKINHGHSITERQGREREISRTDKVFLTEADAYGYLCESLPLQSPDLSFRLTRTSDDDPGAYMWYEFTVFKGEYRVINATFNVVCFTDGTLIEGRKEFTTCTFYEGEVLKPKEALARYRETKKDERKMRLIETGYLYMGRYQEKCALVYVFRYDEGKLYIDASNGELIGHRKDWIT